MKKLAIIAVAILMAGCSAMGTGVRDSGVSQSQQQEDLFKSYKGGSQ